MKSKQIDCSGLTSFLQNTPAANSDIKKSAGLNDVLVSPEAFKVDTPTAQPEVCDGIVAFLDVLGTSSLMESTEKDGIKQEEIQQIYATTIGMQAEFKNSLQAILEKLGDDLKYMAISDSFVISVPNSKDAITALIQFVANFQKICLKSFNQPLRGAIAKGKIIGNITENKIIGSAFIKAYRAEGKLAIYPRIILDIQLIEEFDLDKLFGYRDFVSRDTDGMFYVNFADSGLAEEILTSVQSASQQKDRFSAERQKWDWLCNYLQQKLSIQGKNPLNGTC